MDDRSFRDCVVLTEERQGSSIDPRPQDEPASVAHGLLNKLREGKSVVLVVDDPKLARRKRAEKPLLFFTPLSVYGPPSRLLSVSLQAHGCEIIDTSVEIKSLVFYRMGLGGKMSKALAHELNVLFNLKEN